MLARQRAQIEQPRLHRLQPRRIEREGSARFGQLILGLGRLVHRAIDRGQGLRQRVMFGREPVEPARRLAQLRQAAVRPLNQSRRIFQLVGEARAFLHRRARFGELGFLPRFGRGRLQLGDRMVQPFAVARGILKISARLGQRIFGSTPAGMRDRRRGGVDPPERIEQGAMAPRVQQAAIVMLAMNLNQGRAQGAQQPRRGGLIVDEGAAAAIGADRAANHERFARLDREVVLGQQRQRGMIGGKLEGRGDTRLRHALPHQPGIRAHAQREAERVEQD